MILQSFAPVLSSPPRVGVASSWVFAWALALAGSAGATCLTPPGNVDGNTTTNVVDVQCTLLTALWDLQGEIGPIPACVAAGTLAGADANCDTSVNVADVQITINYSLAIPLTPAIDANGNQCPDSCDIVTCGDAVCDTGETCDDCPGDCGVCPGDCCSEGTEPSCNDASCSGCVCGLDSFCCTDAWDALCVAAAATQCLGNCPCPATVELSCAGGLNCSLQCTTGECSLKCMAAVTLADQPAAAALAACAEANGCMNQPDVAAAEACITANCTNEAIVCLGGEVPESCCDASIAPGCGDTVCEDCVCGLDPFCCSAAWDGLCAQYAAGYCVESCGCVGGANDCIGVAECLIGCSTGACADACYAGGQPGSYGPASNLDLCILAFGCLDAPDTATFQACLAANCAPELGACIDFVTPFPLGCCDVQLGAGCGDATCEGCVCAADAFCCDTAWDSACTQAAGAACGDACGCSPGIAGCVDVVNCMLGCDNSFCVEQCLSFGAVDSLSGATALYICLDAASCLAIEDPIAFDACLTTNCADELASCDQNSCCGPNATVPGCVQDDCEACVCAQDPFCCDTAWDGVCVQQAAGSCVAACACTPGDLTCIDVTNCLLGCVPGDQACVDSCVLAGTEGTGIPALSLLGCLSDNGCLAAPPEQFDACLSASCADLLYSCDLYDATGDCCAPGATPGCEQPACTGCVCSLDSFCCDSSWDELCVEQASIQCQAACGCTPITGADCLATVNCWLACPTSTCEQGCFAAAAPPSLALAQTLLTCLGNAGCFSATTQTQFNACLTANCNTPANACINE